MFHISKLVSPYRSDKFRFNCLTNQRSPCDGVKQFIWFKWHWCWNALLLTISFVNTYSFILIHNF